jgi:hypothetical protein
MKMVLTMLELDLQVLIWALVNRSVLILIGLSRLYAAMQHFLIGSRILNATFFDWFSLF